METNQQHQRREAAQDFEEALEQLEDILEQSETDENIPAILSDNSDQLEPTEAINLADIAAWEDAVADIEEYLEERNR